LEAIANHMDRSLARHQPHVAVIEAYAQSSKMGVKSFARLAEAGGQFRLSLHKAQVPWVEVTPQQLKMAATGAGNAKKPEMIAAAEAAGAVLVSGVDDEADAFWLEQAGLAGYHTGPDVSAPMFDLVDSIEWPHLMGVAA